MSIKVSKAKAINEERKRQGPDGDVKTGVKIKNGVRKNDRSTLNDLQKRMAAVDLNSVKKLEKPRAFLMDKSRQMNAKKSKLLTEINQELRVVPKNVRPPFK